VTTIITDLVRSSLSSDPFAHGVTRIDVLVILLLIALLAERELLRAASSIPADRRFPGTRVLIEPLLTILTIVLSTRLISLVT
jgi:hypothetical protein